MNTLSEYEGMIAHNEYEKLQKAIEINPNLVFLFNGEGCTLLMMSATHNAYECTQILIQQGSDINCKNDYGQPPLMHALFSRNFKIAQYLLQKGADLSARTTDGWDESAFDFARKLDVNNTKWFDLFSRYKDRFDEKDLECYHEMRLPALLN